ncbi:MAG TPA: hypothetical protein VK623_09395 [Flavobacterium sp.]|nr:hypothetical protein [Flavobacterium sp.]
MKKFYILVGISLFSFSVNAQIVTIPDANFKNALVNYLCVAFGEQDAHDADTNNDGEIQLSEALAVENLTLDGYNIASLSGMRILRI